MWLPGEYLLLFLDNFWSPVISSSLQCVIPCTEYFGTLHILPQNLFHPPALMLLLLPNVYEFSSGLGYKDIVYGMVVSYANTGIPVIEISGILAYSNQFMIGQIY